jgi:hypothetical protein
MITLPICSFTRVYIITVSPVKIFCETVEYATLQSIDVRSIGRIVHD